MTKLNYIKGLGLIFGLLLLSNTEGLLAQEPQDDIYVYSLGNLADLKPDVPQITALHKKIIEDRVPSIVLFTGDITKSNLLDPKNRIQDSLRLYNIINNLQSEYLLKFVFIPGDRDWLYSGKSGLTNVNILEDIIESFPFKNLKWTPGHGCPGPKDIEVGDHLTIIAINTQYWNHPHKIPDATDAYCKITSQHDFIDELEDIISEAENKNVLIAGHFPIISSGEYGGHMPLKKHLFPLTDVLPGLYLPLPVVGSFYPAYRQNIGSSMDISNEHYSEFNAELKNIIQDHSGLICLSGHDYIQQLIYSERSYFMNSGAFVKLLRTGKQNDEVFDSKNQSLFRIEYLQKGDVNTTSFKINNTDLVAEKNIELFQSNCQNFKSGIPINEYYSPCKLNSVFPEAMSANYSEPITIKAGEEYNASGFKQLFFGWHYRNTWTTPVNVNYLNMDTTFGGLIPIKRGGGRQTTSLKLRAGNGCEYVFRSVNKDPKKALSYDLRETIVADVVKDQTTTQHPFGAMATKLMLEKLDILHPNPVLYVLPPDDKLGPFKKDYSLLFGMLEESPKGPKKNCPGFGNSDEVLRSYKLFRNLYKSHNNRVDQFEFAKAKVFDILVGDWGRHEDNWKWAGYNQKKGTLYKPIPRDRDHVFSVWDGLFPWIADREWAKPSGEHFGYSVKDIRSLTWSARHIDRIALTEVDWEDWLKQVDLVKNTLTDDIIERSVRNMPEEIYDISGQEIEDKLKSRREHLDDFVLEYYKLLARQVDVLGSGKKEVFYVNRNKDHSVTVIVKNNSRKNILYERKFFPKETKEIRLFGLGNEDEFIITGESDKSIKLRIIGGEGDDKINDQSKVKGLWKKTLVYEKDPGSEIIISEETKSINTWNKKAYDYDRQAFAYNTYFPLPYLSYNSDDEFGLGIGITYTRQGYGKKDYSSKYSLDLKGTTSGNLQFYYDARFHHVFRKWDIKYFGKIAYPTDYVNYYGYGNESLKTDSLFNADYYKTRYNTLQYGIGLIRDFRKRSVFSVMVHYENNEGQISKNTLLDLQQDVLGTHKVNLFEATVMLDLDFRSDKKFPEKGMRFFGKFDQGLITSNEYNTYNKFNGFVEFHSTIPTYLPIIIGLRGGGALSSGDIPFYHLINLGQNNYLRGYRKNRFSGKSMVFFNSDLKLQILDIATAVVPVKFGVRGFYDLGRVYIEDEKSDQFHAGYGGGIYLIPLEKSYSLGLNMGFSEEETAGLIVFEFGISF